MMVAGVIALAGMMTGCMSGKASQDKIGDWQKSRTPVQVLESKIEIKAAGAIVEALDVAPFAIYKAIADKVDGMAALDRGRIPNRNYLEKIQEIIEQGKSKEEAEKEAIAFFTPEQINAINEYRNEVKQTNFDACNEWFQSIGEELRQAGEKFAQEMPNALNQLIGVAKQEGGMALMKIPSQGKDDLAVIGKQLKDCGVGLALYISLLNEDKDAAEMTPITPPEQ